MNPNNTNLDQHRRTISQVEPPPESGPNDPEKPNDNEEVPDNEDPAN
jgi:hypothetical protein